MTPYRDPALEEELCVAGLDPRAAETAFGHLTGYLREPLEAIAKTYWEKKETEDVEAQKRAARAQTAAEVDAYYAQTPQYLYELSYWEATRDKQKWLEVLALACRRWGKERVLDFGGGVGGVTLHLRRRGIRCDHLDVPGNTRDYAGWRFKREGFEAEVLSALEPLPQERYDAVIAWDVFEHLFDLDEAVGRIAKTLKPGGWLISKSTFSPSEQHHIHLEKNFIYQAMPVWNELLHRHGLEFLGQLKPDPLSRLLEKAGIGNRPFGVRVVRRLKHGGNFIVHQKTNKE